MIINQTLGKSTRDATVGEYDVVKDKIAYGKNGKIIGKNIFRHENNFKIPEEYSSYSSYALNDDGIVFLTHDGKNSYKYSFKNEIWEKGVLPLTSSSSYKWKKIINNKNIFIAYTYNNAAYSNDGVTWKKIDDLSCLLDISFEGELFSAIGAGGSNTLWISSDGKTWSECGYSYSETWAFALNIPDWNIIIGISNQGDLLTMSTIDGMLDGQWDTSIGNFSPKKIAYANGKVVAVSSYGNSNSIIYSDTGNKGTWTEVTLPFSGYFDIISNKNNFIVISKDSKNVAYSKDGIVWTDISDFFQNFKDISEIKKSDELFFIFLDSELYFSRDAINWESFYKEKYSIEERDFENKILIKTEDSFVENLILESNDFDARLPARTSKYRWDGVYFLKDRFFAFSLYQGGDYSFDGIQWLPLPLFSLDVLSVSDCCYGNDTFVAVSSNTYNIAYSKDGFYWNNVQVSNSSSAINLKKVCYGNGKFVTIGKALFYSSDGINWISVDISSFGISYFSTLDFVKDRFIAIAGGKGSKKAIYSKDGVNWSLMDFPEVSLDNYCAIIKHNGEKFVLIASKTNLIVSNDGLNWEAMNQILPTFSQVFDDGNKIILVSPSSTSIFVSSDFISWKEEKDSFIKRTGENDGILACAYGNGSYLCVDSSKVIISKDGENWTRKKRIFLESSLEKNEINKDRSVLTFNSSISSSDVISMGGSFFSIDKEKNVGFLVIRQNKDYLSSIKNIYFDLTKCSAPEEMILLPTQKYGGPSSGKGEQGCFFIQPILNVKKSIKIEVSLASADYTNGCKACYFSISYLEN